MDHRSGLTQHARMRRIPILLAILAWAVAAGAQPPADLPTAAELAFERAATMQSELRARIGSERGFRFARERTVLLDTLRRQLAAPVAAGGFAPGTALLLYSRQGDRLRSWLVGRDGILATGEIALPRDAVTDRIAAARRSLVVDGIRRARTPHRAAATTLVPSAGPVPPAAQALGLLERTLIAPEIGHALGAVRHLIVVPADDIALAPLALLRPAAGAAPLVDRLSIAIAPSLQDVIRAVPAWDYALATEMPLIVGDPALPFSPDWIVPPLPGAQAEADGVAAAMRSRALTGDAATRDAVRMRAPGASLLYFATHGIADDADPVDGSFLMFAGPAIEQGWWTAREIQSLRFEARLAVLSACQTGMGGTRAGGIVGLARAFQIAGVPRVAMSLWSVDDAATAYLMTRFAAALRDAPPAEALRRAMVATRARFPAPASWAGFALFGTPR